MNHSTFIYKPEDFSMNEASTTMMTERNLGIFQPLDISPDAFTKAYELAIGEHVEKNYKGLSYLSWPFAFRYLKEQFPTLFVAFEEKSAGWPVFGQEGCWLLRPYLTDGIRRTPALVFPIMDNKHNAVKELDARQVSDNIQRASVKCIATFTGLGLKLYSGEDIPKSDDEKAAPKLPLQQEAPKSAPAAKTVAPSLQEVTTGISEPEAFNGKTALLDFGRANPLGYADERTSMQMIKAGLEALGLQKGDDIKDKEMFANVVTTMVTSWTKEQGIKIAKATMAKEIDALRAICTEGSGDQAIQGVKAFVAGKQ
jgi:formylmethanofuran dehydrogenase subunit D